MTGVTRWWWVRHAPVAGNGGRIHGQDDVPCDTSDTRAFQALAAALPADAVWVTSPLARAVDTAKAITAAGAAPRLSIVERDLAEQNFGRWQGRRWKDIEAADDPTYEAYWRAPGLNAPPGGESFADLARRVAAVMGRLTADHAGTDIVAVTHGGTIRGALTLALALDPGQALSIKVDNLSLTRINHVSDAMAARRGGAWRVVGVNVPVR